MGHKTLDKKSKELAFFLRHDKEYSFDIHGWREISDLIKNHGYTKDELIEIVETNDKKRYEFNDTMTHIRARQGHSINVDVELKEIVPPETAYHGTATRFLNDIMKDGIKKMERNYVHLSFNDDTAFKVGSRHGSPCVIEINTKAMYNDGIKFYLSSNNVLLTEYVEPKYFLSVRYPKELK